MLQLINEGGPVMWALLIASALSILVFFERFFHLHRAQIHSADFLDGLYNVLRRGNVVEAVTLCEDVPGPVAQVVRSAILRADESPADIEESIKQCGLAEIPRLEQGLTLLAVLGRILPMLGFLGTLLALLRMQGLIAATAPFTENLLAASMHEALITSAFGIAAAIPVFAGYAILVSRIESIVLDMEKAAGDIHQFLLQRKQG